MEDFESLKPRYLPLRPPHNPTRSGKRIEAYDYFGPDQDDLGDFGQNDDEDGEEPRGKAKDPDGDGDEGTDGDEDEDSDPSSSFFCQLKSVGPKLLPFVKTVGLYFVIFVPSDRPSWFSVLLKTLPVASLALFVVLHGISLGQQHVFGRKILLALLLSCIGDALLVWPALFLQGMLFFSMAQVAYIWAFGLEPMSGTLGVLIYATTSIGLGLIMPGVMVSQDQGLLVGIPLYFVLLTTMLWRACARLQFFEDLFTWSKFCSCFGSILFVISDSVLGIDKFFVPVPNSQSIIMATYYAAQLGMALSVVNSDKATIRLELDSQVIEIEEEGFASFGQHGQGTSAKGHRGWGNNRSSFDDDEELRLPETRFNN